MEYSINNLAKISGVSTRTLRYYDEIGLLKPAKVTSSKYRVYEQKQVDILQQILFCRELDFSLDTIKKMLSAPDYDRLRELENHLTTLQNKRRRLDVLIANILKSISAEKGETKMTDEEKFKSFKKELIDTNEKKYGVEVRARYGNEIVDESNASLKNSTKEQYAENERLGIAFFETLKKAFETGDPASELAQKACDLHRQQLCIFYPNYNKEYHKALGEMYVTDERFKANYEKIAKGCTEFLRDAINIFCS